MQINAIYQFRDQDIVLHLSIQKIHSVRSNNELKGMNSILHLFFGYTIKLSLPESSTIRLENRCFSKQHQKVESVSSS